MNKLTRVDAMNNSSTAKKPLTSGNKNTSLGRSHSQQRYPNTRGFTYAQTKKQPSVDLGEFRKRQESIEKAKNEILQTQYEERKDQLNHNAFYESKKLYNPGKKPPKPKNFFATPQKMTDRYIDHKDPKYLTSHKKT